MVSAAEEEISTLKAIYDEDLDFEIVDSKTIILRVVLKSHGEGICRFSAVLEITMNQNYPKEPPVRITLRHTRGLNETEIESSLAAARSVFNKQGAFDSDHLLFDAIEKVRECLCQRNGLSLPCAICLCAFETDDEATVTEECGHYFHCYCMQRYVEYTMEEEKKIRLPVRAPAQEQSNPLHCPVCRTPIVYDSSNQTSYAQPIRWSRMDSCDGETEFFVAHLSNPIERHYKELWERQKQNGGLIDLERERDRFLVTENTRLPAALDPGMSTIGNA